MIVLVGFMAAGKSSVGREVARSLGLPFVDTDAVIAERTGATISQIFAAEGEEGFRAIESEVVREVLAGPDAVVALGGGAVTTTEVRAALRPAIVVYLEVDVEEAVKRAGTGGERPMLNARDPEALLTERRPLYESVATVTVKTDGRDVAEVAGDVISRCASGDVAAAGEGILVDLGSRSYRVLVGSGVVRRLAGFVAARRPGKVFVITHPSLHSRAAEVAATLEAEGSAVSVLEVPEGEASKTMGVAEDLCEQIAAAEGHRNDVVVTFGGGVISDLGGFVASIYARGIDVIHVPTTLLGQVDAAIGGKTGVNLSTGKNLVGTFHQPRWVLCDVDLLSGLPSEEFVSGLAEVVKYGLIAEPSILNIVFERAADVLDRDPSVVTDLVEASVRVKAGIVSRDEREGDVRAFLNYGHTFAHAIELARGYGAIRHGEAVSLGMMAAAHLAHVLGRLDAGAVAVHRRTLEAVGLPTTAELSYEELLPAWRRDKKFEGDVRFVLLKALGEPEAGVRADRQTLELALERMRA